MLPVRCEEHGWKHMKLMGDLGQIAAVRTDMRDDAALQAVMRHSNVVVNLVGAEKATSNWSLMDANVELPRRIAAAAARAGVARFVHVSDVLAGVPAAASHHSDYIRAKALGEAAVRAERPDATILRPCDIWGVEDRLLNKLGTMTRRWPVVLHVGPLTRRVQPLWVSDFATAIMHAIRHTETAGRTYELGGPRVFEMQELYRLVQDLTLLPKRVITVPGKLAQPLMNLLGATRKGFFAPDHVKSAELDKVVSATGAGVGTLSDLGVPDPERLEARAYEILRVYRRPIFVNIVDLESQRHITDNFLPGDRP